MLIDMHCHYTLTRRAPTSQPRFSFEPAGTPGPDARPNDYDSCVSDRALGRLGWRLARWWWRLPGPGPALDAWLEQEYARHLGAPGPIERCVLLAFDAVHADDGTVPPLPRRRTDLGSDIYSSNSFIRGLCRRHPGRFLFGASVHPYRADAEAALAEVFAGGACLVKWMPLHQNIDPDDPRTRRALACCARLGLPVLLHYGPEFTLTTQRPAFAALGPLLAGLAELRRAGDMPVTIIAHAATPVTPWGSRDGYRRLLAALAGEFAAAPLYADVSALVTLGKAGFLRALLRRPDLHHKLLFGSDFPVPPSLVRLRPVLGGAYRAVAAEPAWPQRAARACRAAGLSEIVLQRAGALLPNVDYFARGAAPESPAPRAAPPGPATPR